MLITSRYEIVQMNYHCANVQNTCDFGILRITSRILESHFYSEKTIMLLPGKSRNLIFHKIFQNEGLQHPYA